MNVDRLLLLLLLTSSIIIWVMRSCCCLGAATSLDLHVGQLALDHVLVGVEVEHVDGRHLAGGAARTCRAVKPRSGHLDNVGMGRLDNIS